MRPSLGKSVGIVDPHIVHARIGDEASPREAFEHALTLNPQHAAARAKVARL
jgi:hypothetical protein